MFRVEAVGHRDRLKIVNKGNLTSDREMMCHSWRKEIPKQNVRGGEELEVTSYVLMF